MEPTRAQATAQRTHRSGATIGTTDELRSSFPVFLVQIDKAPGDAWDGLHRFTWKLLNAHPTPTMHRLRWDEREDLIAELVEDLRSNDFAKLRKYRDIGKPFANWLLVVADRQARSRIRKSIRVAQAAVQLELQQDQQHFAADSELTKALAAKQVWNQVLEHMDDMSLSERQLLLAASSGMRPRELVEALKMDAGDNKKMSDRLRYLRGKLRAMLQESGIWDMVDDVLNARNAH